MRNRCLTILTLLTITGFLMSCATPKGATVQDQRNDVLKMKEESLAKLYAHKPEARDQIKKAAGYGVFSNVGLNLFLFASGNGFGVVVDNSTGHKTYMKMRSIGVGVGMGVKDVRAVFIFRNKGVMTDFVEKGWEFGGQADAAAKTGDKGAAVGGEAYADTDIIIYQLTEAGVALQATIAGTKYWKDEDLN